MKVVKELSYITISWDEDTRAVVLKWKGGFQGRNLKEGLNSGLEELKKHLPGAQWIGDTSDIGVIGQEEKDWIDQVWFPAFLATKVKCMVVVQPASVVAKMSVREIMAKVPGTALTVYNCSTIEEARTWVKQQKN